MFEDWSACSTTCQPGGASTGSVTLESLRQIMKLLPPGPTREQRQWARDNGFPDYPGFRVGYAAYEALKAKCKRSDIAHPPGMMDSLHGIAVVPDVTLPPDAVLSAEEEWKKLRKE